MGIPAPNGVDAAGLPNLGDQANAVLAGVISAVGPTAAFAFRGPMNLAMWNSTTRTLTTTAGSLAATVDSATGVIAGGSIKSTNVPPGTTVGAISGTNVTLALMPLTYQASGLGLASALVTLPPGSSVANLVGAAVSVPSNAEQVTLPSGTTVVAVVQADIAPSLNGPGQPGVIRLSNAPTVVPPKSDTYTPLQFAPTGNAITTTGADAAASVSDSTTAFDATVQIERSFDGGATFLACNIGGNGQVASYVDLTTVQLTFGEPEKNVLYRLNCLEYTAGTINYRFSQTGGAAESLAIGPLSGG